MDHGCTVPRSLVDWMWPFVRCFTGSTWDHVLVLVAGADELPGPRLLELATPEALAEQRSLVLGDGALDLKQELVARIVGDGMVEELDRASHPAELLQQQHLIGVAPGQAVGGENGNDIDFPVPHRVA